MKSILSVSTLLLLQLSSLAHAQSVTGQRVPCVNGEAAGFPCNKVDLLSKLALPDYGGTFANDVWGWTDPNTGREYALAGRSDGLAFVDVTDPVNPEYLGELPAQNGGNSVWRDFKVYRSHVFVVMDGAGNQGMQVFDLRQLAGLTQPQTFSATYHYNGVGAAHNIVINEDTGYAYIVGAGSNQCSAGLHIVDISNPSQMAYAGCFRAPNTGRSGDGYVHDAQCVLYAGPDTDYDGSEICVSSNETHVVISDVTDKRKITLVAASDYPDVAYAHQGWLSEDHRYFFLNDELDERRLGDNIPGTRTVVWDLEDLDDPVVHGFYYGTTRTIDHNLYVLDHYVMMANYTSGLRIVDFSDMNNPVEVGFFDTHPENDRQGFDGAWSVYPFFQSGTLIVSSDPEGLFMLEFDLPSSTNAQVDEIPTGYSLSAAYPNPFNPATTLTLSLPEPGPVHVYAYDLSGRMVADLLQGTLSAGDHEIRFDASTLASGVYLIIARAGDWIQTQRVSLVK